MMVDLMLDMVMTAVIQEIMELLQTPVVAIEASTA